MKLSYLLSLLTLCSTCFSQTYSPGYYVRTFAGSQAQGHVDSQGLLAKFYYPTFQAADLSSNLYVWDYGNSSIRKVTPDGSVTTLASTFGIPFGMEFGPDGFIWSLFRNGPQYELGRLSTNGDWQYYIAPFASDPDGFCIDSNGKFYSTVGFDVLQYDQFGNVSIYAAGSNFVSASSRLSIDGQDNIYVADWGGSMIRKVDTNHVVTTFAGFTRPSFDYYPPNEDGPISTAQFFGVVNMIADGNGGLYVIVVGSPFSQGTAVRHITSTDVTTLAGSFTDSTPFTGTNVYVNGQGSDARFFNAYSLCKIGDRIMVADSFNNCIREISTNQFESGSPATLAIAFQSNAVLSVTAASNSVHEILKSTDLVNWIPVEALLITNTPSQWVDTNSTDPSSFYRALWIGGSTAPSPAVVTQSPMVQFSTLRVTSKLRLKATRIGSAVEDALMALTLAFEQSNQTNR